MKNLFLLIICLISFGAQAQQYIRKNGKVYLVTPVGTVEIGSPTSGTGSTDLKGMGVTFNGPVKVTSVADPLTGQPLRKVEIWIRNCGNIEIPESARSKELTDGTRIRLRLNGSACTIADWEKF